MLAEILIGSGVYAVAALAQVDRVEVHRQDLFLGVVLLQLQGAENFRDFPLNGNVVLGGQVLDELLGQGGAALDVPAGKHEQHAVDGAPPVHAVVLVEPLILNGDRRIDQVLGDLIQGHPDPVLIPVQGLHGLVVVGAWVPAIHGGGQAHGCVEGIQLKIRLGDDYVFNVCCRHAHQHCRGNDENEHDGHNDLKGTPVLFSLSSGLLAELIVSIVFQFDTSDVDRWKGRPPVSGLIFYTRPNVSLRLFYVLYHSFSICLSLIS